MDFKTLKIKWLPCWLCNVYFIFIILFAVKESYYTKPIEETKPQPERSAIVSAHSKTAGTTSSNKGIFVSACIHFFVCLNIKFNFFMELHFITKLNSVIVFWRFNIYVASILNLPNPYCVLVYHWGVST